MSLRTLMDGILQSTANDMNKQKECVDIALNRRIHETRDSKEKLEDHLSKENIWRNIFFANEVSVKLLISRISFHFSGVKLVYKLIIT